MGKIVKWPDKNEIGGETEALMNLVDNGWDWEWPGWPWVAKRLNYEYHNNRTQHSCRHKYNQMMQGK